MHINAVTAPTRGPDYVAPVASNGTPVVTAPQPATPVATEGTFTAVALAGDTTEIARKKRAASFSGSALLPPRYLTTTRGAVLTALQDIPASHVPFRLAAQAYLAQRRAENDMVASTALETAVDENVTAPTMPSEQDLPPQRSEFSAAGCLDMTA